MPVTRADLKISREYHNRVALVKYPFFATIIVGIIIAASLITYGAIIGNEYVAFSSVPVMLIFSSASISIENVKERPHKRLQRLVIEARAAKELDRARF